MIPYLDEHYTVDGWTLLAIFFVGALSLIGALIIAAAAGML